VPVVEVGRVIGTVNSPKKRVKKIEQFAGIHGRKDENYDARRGIYRLAQPAGEVPVGESGNGEGIAAAVQRSRHRRRVVRRVTGGTLLPAGATSPAQHRSSLLLTPVAFPIAHHHRLLRLLLVVARQVEEIVDEEEVDLLPDPPAARALGRNLQSAAKKSSFVPSSCVPPLPPLRLFLS
jgi:hypothetical protein